MNNLEVTNSSLIIIKTISVNHRQRKRRVVELRHSEDIYSATSTPLLKIGMKSSEPEDQSLLKHYLLGISNAIPIKFTNMAA